jgi:hypothetical protein
MVPSRPEEAWRIGAIALAPSPGVPGSCSPMRVRDAGKRTSLPPGTSSVGATCVRPGCREQMRPNGSLDQRGCRPAGMAEMADATGERRSPLPWVPRLRAKKER